MKNFKDIFREYNDPRVFKNMRLGFLALIICGVLIAFVTSPTLRHSIGIGENRAVQTPPGKVIGQNQRHTHQSPQETKGKHQAQGHQEGVHGNSHNSVGHNTPNGPKGSESPTKPHGSEGNPNGSPTQPASPTQPGLPPSSDSPTTAQPSNGEGTGSTNGGDSGRSKGTGVRVEANPGHVEVEAHVPGVTNNPPVEEGTKGVNEAVGSVTGKVDETTNSSVKSPLPEVCLINC